MKLDTIGELPIHAVIIHLAVVLVPIGAVLAILIAVRPPWRRSWGTWAIGVNAAALVTTLIAYQSGEALRDRFEKLSGSDRETKLATIDEHADLANVARPLVALMFLALAGFVWFARRFERENTPVGEGNELVSVTRSPAVTALAAITVLSAFVAASWTIRTAHEGASSAWKSYTENSATPK